MDATCNGFQHLSLLSLDPSLGFELNLDKSSWNDVPKDFYSFLITSLIDYFKSELVNNKKLSADKKYKDQFIRAFGSDCITPLKMSLAMEQFMFTMVSTESKYDFILILLQLVKV